MPKPDTEDMKNSAQIQSLIVASYILIATSPVFANPIAGQANQRNILPGGRAASMGGAYTAVADDATATFYNPSGLAFSPESRVEVSATAYKYTSLIYEDAINSEPFTEQSESIFPNFIGGSTRFSWFTIGYSFMTLDASSVYQQDSFSGISQDVGEVTTYSRSNQEASTYIWAGASAAIRLGKAFSLGASNFYYQRNIESSTHQLAELNGGGVYSVNDTLKTLNTGLATVVGALFKGDAFALGITTRFQSAISDSTKVSGDQTTDPGGSSSSSDPTIDRWSYAYKPLNELNPKTYSLGACWFPSSYFLLSADVLYHEGVKSPYEGGNDLHGTFNYSLGVELNAASFSVRGGYFTNNSMYREPVRGDLNQPLYLNYRGTSGGIGWNLKGVEGALAVVSQTGKGRAQIIVDSPETQNVVAKTTTYLISGNVPLK